MSASERPWCGVCRMRRADEGSRCGTCARYRRRTGRERTTRFPDVTARQADLNERHALRNN